MQENEGYAEIKAHDAWLSNDHFTVAMAGDLKIEPEKASSENPLTLSLKNYEKFVEYAAAFYNRCQHYLAKIFLSCPCHLMFQKVAF